MVDKIRNVVILGSGVMGSGIAALFANVAAEASLERITMLDMTPTKLTPAQEAAGYTLDHPGVRNLLAQRGLGRIKTDNAMHLAIPAYAGRIEVGNFDDDLASAVSSADLVIEAIVENLELKRALYDRVVPHLNPEAVLGSNTSGIPIEKLMEGYPIEVQRRSLGTHSFNPPRHMKLLELVPGANTSEEVLEFMKYFATAFLGKGVVVARDTPGFVGNRIGVEELTHLLNLAERYGAEKLDYVFGKHLLGAGGKPFVTCEKIGLDTMVLVGDDIHGRTASIDQDQRPGIMPVPQYLRDMVSAGLLGEKSGSGFYAKNGKLVFNIAAQKYEPSKRFGKGGPTILSVEAAKTAKSPQEAHRIMWEAQDEGGEIYREVMLSNIAYSLLKAGEICDGIIDIDNAMKWGYNRALGPGEIADAIGLDKIVEAATEKGFDVPQWVQDLASTGGSLYKEREDGGRSVFDFGSGNHKPIEEPGNVISMPLIAKRSGVIHEVPDAVRMVSLDGVLGVDITSKRGTINPGVIDGINKALDISLEKGYEGVVIANQKDADFSFGADLFLIAGLSLMAQQGDQNARNRLEAISKSLQDLSMRMRYHELPVVTAKQGKAVGGGCELGFGAPTRAAQELNAGLVEFKVGIVPGGGGMKELLFSRYEMRTANGRLEYVDPVTYVMDTVKSIAWNWFSVSTSADDAIQKGFLRLTDRISRNSDSLVYDAKDDVIRLAHNYIPPVQADRRIALPGSEGYVQIMNLSDWAVRSGNVVHEYVPRIMEQMALALTTGPRGTAGVYTEQEILDRERAAFMNLALGDHLTTVVARNAFKNMDRAAFEAIALQLAQSYLGGN